MKRPLAVTGFTMLFTLLVLSGSNDKAISAVLLAALIAFVVFMCIKKVRRDKTLPFAALSAAVAVLLLMSNNAYYLGKAKPLNGKEVIISGTLSDLPYEKDGSFYYVVKADTVNGEKSSLSFRVVSKAPLCIDVTDEVNLSAKAFLLGGDSDEILKYYKSKSLFLGAHSPENISIKRGEKKSIGTMLLLLRQKLTSETLRLLPNTYGGLVAGLCYGDKSNIPRNVTTAFSAAGVSHLLAVSGLHLSVWSSLLYMIMRKLRVSRRISSASSIVFIILFAILTGMNPPVVRAGTMIGLVFAADLFKREADSLNSIGLSLILLLAFNPYMSTSLSLWLSLAATLGMMYFLKPLTRALDRPIANVKQNIFTTAYKSVSSLVAVSLAVTVASLPVFAVSLPTVSTVSVLSNLLMVTVGSVCMTSGGLGALFMLIKLDIIGKPLVLLSGITAKYLTETAVKISEFHHALLPIDSIFTRISIAAALIVFAVVLLLGYKNKTAVKRIAITLFCMIFLSAAVVSTVQNNKLCIAAVSVGDGSAVVMKYKYKTYVVGCGGNYFSGSAVCDIINTLGSSNIDYIILPEDSEKSLSGVRRVKETYRISSAVTATDRIKDGFSFDSVVSLNGNSAEITDGKLKITVQDSRVYVSFGDSLSEISFGDVNDGSDAGLLICRGLTGYEKSDIILVSTDKTDIGDLPSQKVILTSQNGTVLFTLSHNGKMTYRRMA